MQSINARFRRFVFAYARADIVIERRIGKAEVVLVRSVRQAVRGYFVNQMQGQAEVFSHRFHLLYGQFAKWGKVACRIAVAGGIANPILGQIAGVCHSAIHRLREGVEGGHTDTRGKIDHRLAARFYAACFQAFQYAVHCFFDVANVKWDTQVRDEFFRIVNIALLAVGHKHADNSFFPKRFYAQRRDNGAILTARNADDGVTAFSVNLKPISYPLYGVRRYLFYVEIFHNDSFFLAHFSYTPNSKSP